MKPSQLLIVEDEILLATVLESRLIDFGYRVVDIVRAGENAISAAEQLLPDLILMDIRLSGKMDGIDAALEIRKNHDIPLIFMTSCADEDTRQRAAAAEPGGFLPKLTDDRELRTVIEAALAGRRTA